MSELISGKDALIAIANGEKVQAKYKDVPEWSDLSLSSKFSLDRFIDRSFKFRLKPRTISINGIEVPAPFKPKDGDGFRIYYLHGLHERGYDWMHSTHYREFYLVWRTEDEIKQVVAALRQVFGGAK